MNWRLDFRNTIAAAAADPQQAVQGISGVENPAATWTLRINRHSFVNVDVKLSQAVSRFLPGVPELHKEVNLQEEFFQAKRAYVNRQTEYDADL